MFIISIDTYILMVYLLIARVARRYFLKVYVRFSSMRLQVNVSFRWYRDFFNYYLQQHPMQPKPRGHLANAYSRGFCMKNHEWYHRNNLIMDCKKDLADSTGLNAVVRVWARRKSKNLRIKHRKWNWNSLWKVFLVLSKHCSLSSMLCYMIFWDKADYV